MNEMECEARVGPDSCKDIGWIKVQGMWCCDHCAWIVDEEGQV